VQHGVLQIAKPEILLSARRRLYVIHISPEQRTSDHSHDNRTNRDHD
jgi:hypothetical protein